MTVRMLQFVLVMQPYRRLTHYHG